MKKVVFPTGSWKFVDSEDFVKGQLDFDKLFLRIAQRYHVTTANTCCPIDPTALPVKYNKTLGKLQYFDNITKVWITAPATAVGP